MLFSVRALRLLIHLLVGLIAALAVRLSLGRLSPYPVATWWSSTLLDVFNIQLQVSGQAHRGGRMTVANHVSWLDIPLIYACEGTHFVAKSEIRHWPVAGWLANAARTFYIRRGRGGAAPLLRALRPHLRSGGSVTIFPEGTTTDGLAMRPFHSRLFAAAIEADCLVQPVAIRYGRAADGELIAPFIGEDTLAGHIIRLLREPVLQAELIYCAPIRCTGLDRDELARRAQAAVARALEQPSPSLTRPEAQAQAA